MKYAVKWGRPTYRSQESKVRPGTTITFLESPIYTSKCGTYKITGHMMCGSRNGTANVREWRTWKVVEGSEDVRLGTADKWADAKAYAEWQINPDWEPN